MTSETLNIASLMRQARKAVAREDFGEAEGLYAKVLEDPEMASLIDIKARHAFCVEKNGKISEAIKLYEDIVEIYLASGEDSAAKALRLKIGILSRLRNSTQSSSDFLATLDSSMEAAFQGTAGDLLKLDEMDLLSLGTHDLSEFSDSATQKLGVSREVLVDSEALEPDEPVCVDVKLTELDSAKPDKPLEQTADLTEEIAALKPKRKAKNVDKSLHKLKGLIRHGILRNKTDKSTEHQEVEFTDIGDYELALSEKATTATGSYNHLFEDEISKTAEDLFGGVAPKYRQGRQ